MFSLMSIFFLFLLLTRTLVLVRSECYYPSGTTDGVYDYSPCVKTNSDGHSACCIPSEDDKCLSNGLCYFPAGNYTFRGGCTDPTWKSDACPKLCTSTYNTSWTELVPCGGTKYCCLSEGSLCCTKKPESVFDMPGVSIIVDMATWTTAPPEPFATASGVGSSSATSSAKTTNGTSNTSSDSKGGINPVTVGIAVAVPFGLLAIAGIIFTWWCTKRRANKPNSTTPPPLVPSAVGYNDLPSTPAGPQELAGFELVDTKKNPAEVAGTQYWQQQPLHYQQQSQQQPQQQYYQQPHVPEIDSRVATPTAAPAYWNHVPEIDGRTATPTAAPPYWQSVPQMDGRHATHRPNKEVYEFPG